MFKIIICFILILPTLVFSKYANVDLIGNELLIELKMVGPSTTPPGIYAYNIEKDELQIVMPFAIHPKWSPDHKKIAFYLENSFFIFDITSKQYNKIKIDNDLQLNFPTISSNYLWSDNNHIFWMTEVDGLDITNNKFYDNKFNMDTYNYYKYHKERVNRLCYISDDSMKIFNQTDIDGQFSGQLSIDYKNKLYVETIENKKHDNLMSSTVIVGRIGWDNVDIIKQENHELSYNPYIQPEGHLIAYESLSRKNGLTSIKIYDTFEKISYSLFEESKILGINDEDSYLNSRKPDFLLYGWLPYNNLLLYGIKEYNYNKLDGYVNVYIMNINEKKEKKIKGLAGTFNIIWSSDGKKIAGLKPFFEENSKLPSQNTIEIISLDDEKNMNVKSIDIFLKKELKYKNMIPFNLNW